MLATAGCSLTTFDSIPRKMTLEGQAAGNLRFVAEELLEEPNSTRPIRPPGNTEMTPDQFRIDELIVVGNVSACRKFDDQELDRVFRQYRGYVYRLSPDQPPKLDREGFARKYSGWSRLKTFSIPGFFGTYKNVIIPGDLASSIQFSSSVGTLLAQGTGALVVARTTKEGLFVIVGQLCAEDSDYSDCSEKFRRGTFDGVTGWELDDELKVKELARRIDTETFQLLPKTDQDTGGS